VIKNTIIEIPPLNCQFGLSSAGWKQSHHPW